MASPNAPFNIDGGIHQIPLGSATATMGNLWLCGKHHIAPDPESVRARHGVDHIHCLVEEHELRDRYDRYIDWLSHNHGRTATWTPIPDLSFPGLEEGMAHVESVFERLRAGQSVIVHCAAGIGRAGTIAVAVSMLSGMSRDHAMTHVRTHRPMAGPESGAQQRFIEQLSTHIDGSRSIDHRLH